MELFKNKAYWILKCNSLKLKNKVDKKIFTRTCVEFFERVIEAESQVEYFKKSNETKDNVIIEKVNRIRELEAPKNKTKKNQYRQLVEQLENWLNEKWIDPTTEIRVSEIVKQIRELKEKING